MRDFVIMTDSCCDLTDEMARELGIVVVPLSLEMGGQTYRNWLDGRDIAFQDFYSRIRAGETATTSAVSVGDFQEQMRAILSQGKDILYLSFSSALSTTYQSAVIAADDLREEFPDGQVLVVDSRCASLGQGLLVYLCAREKAAGRSLTGLRDYAEATKGQICHWFTVDDLNHLKRGGRISAATALVGTMLSISKARGRKASLMALVDRMEATALDAANGTVFISHGDCEGDALLVADEITRRFGNRDIHLNYVEPVIGNHSGPGTVALFFVGSKR